MKILAIETSCDDTSIAIVEATGGKTAPRFEVLANIVSSQTAIHRHWGGVVPNLAKREHLKNLPKIYRALTKKYSNILKNVGISSNADSKLSNIDLVAVTVGPGLEPSLWTGIEFAKKLSAKLKIPLVGANHLEGHLYSFLLPPLTPVILIRPPAEKNPTRSFGRNPQDDARTP
ncbi:MAG: hypothetical protein HYW56_02220, partial [Candidatus Harrisonbacteria bacterium]|nr:hypothetical protein [Candidatus Harrisonbacteria bacterium]